MKLHKLISTVDMSHEEWLRYRKLGIGGSDAGSICGLNPYSSAIAVFQDKTQKEAGEKEDNEAMRQGRDLEEYVARRFMEETGKKVRRANAIYGHPDHDFMMANVDRLVVGENAGLECKTASAYSADKWKDGHIPESYEIQCHHYMAVTGADAWYIACVVLGKEFIHSPSKVFKDEIGKHIVGGVIKGIEAEVPKLKKTMKKMSEEAVKAAGEVDAAKGGYSDAASAIMESITSGLDKRQELLVSKLDNKIDGYVDKVVKKYEKLAEDKKTEAGNTTDATQKKKLQEEAKKFRKNAKKIKNYANKYTSTFMDALKEGTEKAYSKIEDDLDKKLDEIAEKYQKAYDRIISFRDDMKKKMSDPANMYDLDTQLTQVERYQEGLKKLKDKIPESLMDQILGMDLNEADNFVEHLNAMSEEELEAYKKKWEQLQGSSETYSKEFFEQRLTDTKAGWTKEVEEAAKTAQEATEEAGKEIAKSLIKSLNGEKETLKKSMRGIAKDMIEAFKKAFGLGKSNKSAKSTKTSTNAKGTTTSGKTTAKKKKAKGTDDSELDLEALKANAASKKKIQKLAKKGRLSEVGKVLEALPTPFEDTEQKKAALQKLDPKLLASLDRFEQTVNQLGNFITVSNAGNASIGKLLEAASNQTIQLQAELHTTVDLDGRTVGKAVTPYVNENMNTIRNRQRRGS